MIGSGGTGGTVGVGGNGSSGGTGRATSAIPRRSKHQRRDDAVVGVFDGRRRVDWRRRGSRPVPPASPHGAAAGGDPSVAAAPAARNVADPRYLVAAVPNLEGGRLSSHDHDLFGAARDLADEDGGGVLAIVFGDCQADLALCGCDRLVQFADPRLAGFAPEARLAALQAAVAAYRPSFMLFPDCAAMGADLGRRFAAAAGMDVATNVWSVDRRRCVRRTDNGASDERRPTPPVVLLAPEAASPVTGVRHAMQRLAAPPFEVTPRIVDLGRCAADPALVPLPEADFIIAGGNGVMDWDAFHAAAAALGATEGASRVAVDTGWMPRDRQVGSSGTVVGARFYLAVGISGAPQHLQGIDACEHVIAINVDPNCAMVKRADLAVIADATEVLTYLTSMSRQMRAHD